MNEQVKILSKAEVGFLKSFLEEFTYNSLTQIVYRGQVPMAAYVLLEGKILLRDSQKKIAHELKENCLIGFNEICLNKGYKYTAEIQPASKVLILDRSTIGHIKEIFETEKPGESYVTEALLTAIS